MIIEIIAMLIIALALGISLALASKKFYVQEDPKVQEVFEVLPHNNCGACGFPGCLAFAKAVAENPAATSRCRVGGPKQVDEIGRILGVKINHEEPLLSRALCKGNCTDKFEYQGVATCRSAAMISNGPKSCKFSCLGFGDCALQCQFGAMSMQDSLPVVNLEKCNGCGLCVEACPKNVLRLSGKSQSTTVRCSSTLGARANAKNCKFGCISCGTCVTNCAAKSITIKDNLAVVDFGSCTHCGICAKLCPRKTIEIA
jgi:RnfABCDGE-type electron transport complex B subunit